ncbi:MAG: NYN domain-containing protein [Xenophilus sp.]
MNAGAALFVDADNIAAALVEKAVRHLLKAYDAVPLRRAHGGHEKLAGMKDVLRAFGFRAFVNHGRGTTDIGLAVDCMDLMHGGRLPPVVALASSDADFAALAIRLRESGCRVLCFAHRAAADEEALVRNYDQVLFDDAFGLSEVTGQVMRMASAPLTPSAPAKPPAAPKPAAPANADGEDFVRRVLAMLPDWLPNTVRQLNQLGTPVQEAGVKRGSKPLHDLFRQHPDYFRVLPSSGPAKQVKLLQRPSPK